MASHDEVVTLVDDKDNIVGTKKFSELNDNDRWRIIGIWVTNPDGQVLICKRAPTKSIEPNKWGPGAAGTVTHPDSYAETARRELFEELGIKNADIKVEKVIFYDAAFGKRTCGLARVELTKNAEIIPQVEEISDIKWIDLPVLKEDVRGNPEKYTKNMIEFMEYFDEQ